MTVTTLLIFWAVPLLHAGSSAATPCVHAQAGLPGGRACVLQPATNTGLPTDPVGRGPGISADDEEDSVEDGFSGNGLLIADAFRGAGPRAFFGQSRVRHDLSGQSHHPHPLRC